MPNRIIRITFLFILNGFSFAFAQTNQIKNEGDVKIGREIVMKGIPNQGVVACMSCHKENGEGISASGFPQLAGLNSAYLEKQLQDYKNLMRINPVMQPIAKALKEEDIKNVVAYFASLPMVEMTEVSKNQKKLKWGQSIAEKGLWNKGVPSCYACHAENAVGVGNYFPRLVYQGKKYLMQQLTDWKKGLRKNDPNQLMKSVAIKLSPQEMDAVTEYIGTLKIQNKSEAIQ